MQYLPSVLTMMNLSCGVLSVFCAGIGHLQAAAVFVAAGVIMDAFDGKTARLLDAASPFGQELDSLADLVSFGVAPAAVFFFTNQGTPDAFGGLALLWSAIAACLFVIFGAFRLARFNVTSDHSYYLGLPITIAGLALVATVILTPGSPLPWLVLAGGAGLMVSHIRVPKI